MREQLLKAFEEAIAASNPAPSNEQETCFRIVDPLLRAMGYKLQDIKIQDRNNAGEKPDYTILPDDSDHTWFLEAKAWGVRLSEKHAYQGVNYANTQGKRWVVVTNGQEWRMYDNHIFGTVDAKLACVAYLHEESFLGFLEALAKGSVQQGKLEGFVRNKRLYACLSDQVSRSDSEVIKAVCRVLRQMPGLGSVTATDIVGFLGTPDSGQSGEAPRADRPQQSGPPTNDDVVSVDSKVQVVVEPRSSTYSTNHTGNILHLITPVKDEKERTAEETIRTLLDSGWYVFGERTAGRKRMKPGDRICFYVSKVGVVAEATVASAPELGEVPGVRNPEKYPWRFRVEDVRFFFDQPVAIDAETRRKLDGFQKNPESKDWSWFIQGTGIITEHDFNILTRVAS